VAYVRTKAGWKITTAIPEHNFYTDSKDKDVVKIMARISQTLIRLIVGEEKSAEMFTAVENGFMMISHCEPEKTGLIESVIMARVLHVLGYIGSNAETEKLFRDFSDFGPHILDVARLQKARIISAINKGLKASQL
jgi:hypothetical protein